MTWTERLKPDAPVPAALMRKIIWPAMRDGAERRRLAPITDNAGLLPLADDAWREGKIKLGRRLRYWWKMLVLFTAAALSCCAFVVIVLTLWRYGQ